MKSIRTFLIILMSCLNFWAEAQTAVTDSVSHELAIKRQSQVANVLYTLHFPDFITFYAIT